MSRDGRADGLLVIFGSRHSEYRRRPVVIVILILIVVWISSHFWTLGVRVRHRHWHNGLLLLALILHRSHRPTQPPEYLRSINREEKYQHDERQSESYDEVNFQVFDFSWKVHKIG